MKQWYEELFDNYADKYDQEGYTSGTLGEVDFIEKELDYDKNKLILDVGCGTGRHSLELARRGYSVTGIDLSESMLEKAIKTAAEEKLKIHFIKKVLKCNERYYTPPEINWLLKSIGFTRTEIFGCHLGAFSRNNKLTTEDYEMLVVASNVA